MAKYDLKRHNLKYWRGVLGYTQNEMGVLIGCKGPNYSKKENGLTDFTLTEMLTIQSCFNKKLVKMGQPPLMLDDIFLSTGLRIMNK